VGKDKLRRFAEIKTFGNVFEYDPSEIIQQDLPLKGKWNSVYFKNDNPLVVELACGKGEYSVGLAQIFPDKNFIGIDIKGNRIWRGAKTAVDNGMKNVAFVRTRIEMIYSVFEKKELDEIWITFPDPQPNKPMKRLTSSRFLKSYFPLLKSDASIHLKTDSAELYEYTLEVIRLNGFEILAHTSDLYHSDLVDKAFSIYTHYEKLFLNKNKKITYIHFKLRETDGDYFEPEKIISNTNR